MSPNAPQKHGGPPNRPGGQQGKGGTPASSQGLEYPLPKEVVDVFKKVQVSNPGLVFERFIPYMDTDKAKRRKQALDRAKIQPNSDARKAAYERWQTLAKACGAQIFTLKTDWRFIPGLGRKTALEIGFGFHRYGFPYLPASSVKGIARAWALFKLGALLSLGEGKLNNLDQTLSKEDEEFAKAFEYFKPSPEAKELAKTIRLVFGTLDQAGGAVFFDAMPTSEFPLDIDIMNPHYAPYYQDKEPSGDWHNGTAALSAPNKRYDQDKEPPGDWHNPNPITFLAVPKDKEFAFAVAWRRGAPRADLLEQACTWLKNGLRDLGAGAKTSAGYGYFR
ncbi:type III-B CRISPR module RAMP protein Cmr6 [Anaerolinea sp.]|uniref:type III-B CRISPR module RAMP protein Cmr6 n=1 Tax=Anaerolinea sp. TaxID=1872519 RepID=UPI002ACDF1FF|nr:type III-B CRISPR module RAMP protein Cmr6 [Anaerolinea sp.]